MPSLGAPELIIIALVIILLFGWKRLPDAARSLGRSARVFKAEVHEMQDEDQARKATAPVPPPVVRDPSVLPPVRETTAQPPVREASVTPPLRDADTHRDGNALLDDNSPRTDNKSGPIS